MRIIILTGGPAVGKTSILIKTLQHLLLDGDFNPSIAKIDCLKSNDKVLFEPLNIPLITGLSGHSCPDHYLATNLNHLYD